MMSVFLLNCLEATGYFERNPFMEREKESKEESILEKRIMFAGLIFHAYSVILPNNHSVGEVDNSDLKSFVGIKRNLLGNCVFPRVASILNHSCDPNTSPVYINGNTQVTVAMTCISKGQEISHIYQGHFGDTAKQERQRILKNMFHMKTQLFKSVSPSSYFQKIRTEVESYIPNEKDSTAKKDFMDDLSKKLKKRKLSEEQKLKEIFKTLEVYHQSSDKEIS